jgi:hypothetical protein
MDTHVASNNCAISEPLLNDANLACVSTQIWAIPFTVDTVYAPQTKIWDEQKMNSGFSTDFSMVRSPNRVLTPLKSASFEIRSLSIPNEDFGWVNVIPPKRRFGRDEPTFPNAFPGDALFKFLSILFGTRIVENVPKTHSDQPSATRPLFFRQYPFRNISTNISRWNCG